MPREGRRDAGATRRTRTTVVIRVRFVCRLSLGSFSDVCGLRPFCTLGHLKLHLIALLKTFVAFRSDRAVVDEDIRAAIVASYEAVTFCVIKPLHRTFQTFHLRPLGHVLLQVRSYPSI